MRSSSRALAAIFFRRSHETKAPHLHPKQRRAFSNRGIEETIGLAEVSLGQVVVCCLLVVVGCCCCCCWLLLFLLLRRRLLLVFALILAAVPSPRCADGICAYSITYIFGPSFFSAPAKPHQAASPHSPTRLHVMLLRLCELIGRQVALPQVAQHLPGAEPTTSGLWGPAGEAGVHLITAAAAGV